MPHDPPMVEAPAGAPNVLVVLLDDVTVGMHSPSTAQEMTISTTVA